MRVLRLGIVPACVALCAALAAHVAIDVAGDYLLPADTYDGIAHGSRTIAALVALVVVVFATLGGVRALVRAARGSERAFCAVLRSTLPRSPLAFGVAIVAATFPILLAMEALDARLAGADASDLGDLLGGSVTLGCGVTLVVTLVATAVAWFAIRRLARARVTFARLIAAFVHRERERVLAVSLARRPRRDASTSYAYLLVRRFAGRAPPQRLSS